MNRDETVAYINSQVACANIEAMGMHADNQKAKIHEEHPYWYFADFQTIPDKYQITQGHVVDLIRKAE